MGQKTYRIGEAAAKLNLKSYVLRFWETEFPQIAPLRTEKGQRLYTESDLAVLGRIRYLLHERGLTIDGARRQLDEEAARGMVYSGKDATTPPENTPEEHEAIPDEDDYMDTEDGHFPPLPEAAPPSAPSSLRESGGGLAQASLFSFRKDDPAVALADLRDILAELAAIRHLLVRDEDRG